MPTLVGKSGVFTRPLLARQSATRARWRDWHSRNGRATLTPVQGPSRRGLQIALGLLWLLDGLLQFQPSMFNPYFYGMMFNMSPAAPPGWLFDVQSRFWPAVETHAVLANALFASLQVVLGLGLFWRRSARLALAASVPWALAVWLFGEAAGGLFVQGANALTGAPGSALLYAVTAVMLWPRKADAERTVAAAGPLGGAANLLWVVLWLGTAALEAEALNRTARYTSAAVQSAGSGGPAWISHISNGVSGLVGPHGPEAALAMGVAQAMTGLGILWHRSRRVALVGGMALALLYGIAGQDVGGLLSNGFDIFHSGATDPGTAPIICIIALALWPRHAVVAPRIPAPRLELRTRQRRFGVSLSVVILSLLLASCSSPAARVTAPSTTPSGGHTSTPETVPTNIYAAAGANMFSPAVGGMRSLVYVPESTGSEVDVIDPTTYTVIDRYQTGTEVQHVVPSWDLQTLYATNDAGDSLTPISPYTGKPEGPNVAVADPYNLYFTPDGRYAIVVEERNQVLSFRDPHTFAVMKDVPVDCAGVDHGDFSANGSYAIFSCEFSSKMVKIDLATLSVDRYLTIPGSSPQDVKLDPTGHVFYTSDMYQGGVWMIDAATFKTIGFIPTGRDAHGLYTSRDSRYLYVSNRGAGSVSVIDFTTRKVVATWVIPGGGSPDMGNVSADGTKLWLSGRYNDCVYVFSTIDGHLLAEIPVPNRPHGLAVWPQPGRYSVGHTGIMR
jgi:YVTN family beta-propeller protein